GFDRSVFEGAGPGIPLQGSFEHEETIVNRGPDRRVDPVVVGFRRSGIVPNIVQRVDLARLRNDSDGRESEIGVTALVEEGIDHVVNRVPARARAVEGPVARDVSEGRSSFGSPGDQGPILLEPGYGLVEYPGEVLRVRRSG